MSDNTSVFMQIMQNMIAEAEDDTSSRPHPIAQRDELRIRMTRYHETAAPFKCGDFVKEKQGLGFMDARDTVHMFWRFLDFEEPVDWALMEDFIGRVSIPDIDCLLWRLSDDGRTVLFVPHSCALLELDTEQEDA